jgi:hypothetical protein
MKTRKVYNDGKVQVVGYTLPEGSYSLNSELLKEITDRLKEEGLFDRSSLVMLVRDWDGKPDNAFKGDVMRFRSRVRDAFSLERPVNTSKILIPSEDNKFTKALEELRSLDQDYGFQQHFLRAEDDGFGTGKPYIEEAQSSILMRDSTTLTGVISDVGMLNFPGHGNVNTNWALGITQELIDEKAENLKYVYYKAVRNAHVLGERKGRVYNGGPCVVDPTDLREAIWKDIDTLNSKGVFYDFWKLAPSTDLVIRYLEPGNVTPQDNIKRLKEILFDMPRSLERIFSQEERIGNYLIDVFKEGE